MIRSAAVLFGILFLAGGILGFLPSFAQNNHLLGCFLINPTHNFVHIITGVFALWTGCTSLVASKIFFRIFGTIYVLVAALGLYYGDQPIFGLIANNMADVGLHLAVGVIALSFGFGCTCSSAR